jgi:hypothetical protein
MAYTDAISNATKMLGLGADIWFANDKTKYTEERTIQTNFAAKKAADENYILDNIIAVKDFLSGNADALKYYLDLFHHRTPDEFLDEECLRIFEQLKKNKKL